MIKLSFGKAIAAILLAILAAASGARAQSSVPVPIITSISPVSALPGGAQFTLTVNGANFSSSHVLWNGDALTTTTVSSEKLTATISATLIATAGTASVSVANSGVKIVAVPVGSGATPAGATVPFETVSNVFYFPVTSPITAIKVTTTAASAGAQPFQIAVGDFNADGKLDMAVSNSGGDTVSILLGKGDGTFQTPTAITTAAEPEGIAVGDLNGDGRLDLVIGGLSGLNVALGNGSGGFTVTALAGGSEPASPVLADVNGDGFLDIVVGSSGSPLGILVYLGKGDGTFQAPVTYPSGGQVFSVVVADFNGDGHLDIAAADFATGTVDVYLGDGTGAFGTATTYTAVRGAWAMAAGDFNGDGNLDLAVSSNANPGGNGIVLLLGKGDGTFKAPSEVIASGNYLGLAAGDLSGDGNLDLVTIVGGFPATGLVQAWFGNGDGTFQAPQTITNAGEEDGVALGGFATGAGLMTVSTGTNSVNISQQIATLSPASFNYGSVNVGTPLASVFTLTNSTAAAFTPTTIDFTGTNAVDFTEMDDCFNNSLAAGTSCTISATFTPSAAGARAATLQVLDNATGNPQTASLSGTGVAVVGPTATPSVSTVAFGNENLTVTSASMPVTLTDSGSATLTGLAISITGTNSTDFAQTSTCTATLAVSASCIISVTFTPTALGARTASLQFTDNASDSPQSVALTGTGVQVAEQLLYIDAPPPTLIAGGNIGTVTVGVYTMQSMLITSANDEIRVTITGPNSFNQSRSTAAVSGVATFDFSAVPLDAAGSYTITAAIDNVVRSKSRRAIPANSVSIAPAVATTVVSAQSSPTQMNVSGYHSPTFTGFAHTFTVSVTDMFLNPIATYTGTVTLSSSDTAAVLTPSPYTFVSGDMGAHTFTGTLNTAGTQSITATDSQHELSGSQTGIVVNAAPQFVVTTLTDDAGTALCDGDEACSLRSAVTQANTAGGAITMDTSQFGGSGPFTTTLNFGVLELKSNISITGPSGFPPMTISAGGTSAIFLVDSGAVATISTFAITSGSSTTDGGAISNAGTLTLANLLILGNNTLTNGGSVANTGTLTITNSAVGESSAAGNGGGITNSGTLTILSSNVSNSTATLNGGGISSSGTLTVNSSTVGFNTASENGGGASISGTAVFYDSTINGNTATGNGGGFDNSGSLSLPQSTIYGNTAANGSAIENEAAGTIVLLQCTVTQNSATANPSGTILNLNNGGSAVKFLNTIDAGNTSADGDCVACGPQSSFNVFGVPAADLGLGGLAGNGGLTQTVLPQPGSQVLRAGSVPLIAGADLPQSFANDQRGTGFPRVVNNMVDLGAVETQPVAAVALQLEVAGSAVAGEPINIAVTALTQAQNPATTFTDTIHVTSSDPQAQLPSDYTFVLADAGAHLFIIALETSGAQTLTVTDIQQPLLTATQSITVAAAAASSIVAVAGSGQTASPGSAFAIALEAKVTDAFGNLIPAIPVTFTAPTTGASGTFAGGVSAVTISTLTTGIATAPAFTANSTAGQYTVTAGATAQAGVTGRSTIHPATPSLTPASFTMTNGVPPSYTVTANPAILTIVQGQSGTTVLTFTPVGGFAGTVSLTCSGLPADADCVFVPAQAVMTGNNQAVTVTLTVNTTGANGQLSQLWPTTHRVPGAGGSNTKLPALFGMFLAIAVLGWSSTRAKRPRRAMAAFALLVVLTGVGMAACTHTHAPSMAATVPGNYPVNVTASIGTGGTQTAVVMITIVQQ